MTHNPNTDVKKKGVKKRQEVEKEESSSVIARRGGGSLMLPTDFFFSHYLPTAQHPVSTAAFKQGTVQSVIL